MDNAGSSPRVLAKLSKAGTGTNSGVTVTVAHNQTGKPDTPRTMSLVWTPTRVTASSDTAADLTIESDTGTVIWKHSFSGAFAIEEEFDPGDIMGADASTKDISVKISASTSKCAATLIAALIPNPVGVALGAAATIS